MQYTACCTASQAGLDPPREHSIPAGWLPLPYVPGSWLHDTFAHVTQWADLRHSCCSGASSLSPFLLL